MQIRSRFGTISLFDPARVQKWERCHWRVFNKHHSRLHCIETCNNGKNMPGEHVINWEQDTLNRFGTT